MERKTHMNYKNGLVVFIDLLGTKDSSFKEW